MFLIVATKPLNDGTKGFRFNVLGQKGFYRKRANKSNGIKTQRGNTFYQIHVGKRPLAFERKNATLKLRQFAG